MLVLDSGSALEYDTPKELLTNPKYSEFASMVAETGPETAKYLHSVAVGNVSHEEVLEQKLERTESVKREIQNHLLEKCRYQDWN